MKSKAYKNRKGTSYNEEIVLRDEYSATDNETSAFWTSHDTYLALKDAVPASSGTPSQICRLVSFKNNRQGSE